ncbi:MAG: chalcone isomerase family protein [Bdellovibrionales bacterium]|nr:chalcone isomerase family protein [Bdellovibrionales bacterium]
MKKYFTGICLTLSLLSSTAVAEETCVAGACFPNEMQIGDGSYPLRGAALFEWYLFDVYSAAFYAPEGVDTIEEALGDVPKYLVLHYHGDIKRQNIIDNSEHILKENPANDMAALRDRLDRMYTAYSDVGEGDRFAMRYEPGKGTTLLFNGTPKAVLEGVDFQQAYFGIWLSRFSVGSKFTQRLLGTRS